MGMFSRMRWIYGMVRKYQKRRPGDSFLQILGEMVSWTDQDWM
jgi:hypothetical protein